MESNATTENNIRALPIYRLGFDAGRNVGLRLGLDAITSERVRLEQLASRAHSPYTLDAGRAAYADARLLDVAKVIAANFRGP